MTKIYGLQYKSPRRINIQRRNGRVQSRILCKSKTVALTLNALCSTSPGERKPSFLSCFINGNIPSVCHLPLKSSNGYILSSLTSVLTYLRTTYNSPSHLPSILPFPLVLLLVAHLLNVFTADFACLIAFSSTRNTWPQCLIPTSETRVHQNSGLYVAARSLEE
jgi:hypothetical protein